MLIKEELFQDEIIYRDINEKIYSLVDNKEVINDMFNVKDCFGREIIVGPSYLLFENTYSWRDDKDLIIKALRACSECSKLIDKKYLEDKEIKKYIRK